jgi:hypothetical protein
VALDGNKPEKFVEFLSLYPKKTHNVILSDFKYWSENEGKLKQWLFDNNAGYIIGAGIIVEFCDTESFLMFKLRWS